MALKSCNECGNEISDKAKSCPQCGAAQPQKTSMIAWIVAGIFAFSIFLAIFGGSNENKSTLEKDHSSEVNEAPAKNNVSESEKQTFKNWATKTSTDEMRGTKINSTATMSKNQVSFEFPYNGGSNLFLTVRSKDKDKDIIIFIDKGQFICSIGDGCKVNFKFDDGPIKSILMVGSDSYDSNSLFVNSQKDVNSLIEKIKTSKTVIIEPNFYKEGKKQFSFELEGFKEP